MSRVAVLLSATSLYLGMAGEAASPAPQIMVERGIQYAEHGGVRLLLDAYLPAGEGPFPGVIVIHGGGYHKGDRQSWAPEATVLAQNGVIAFAMDYRLAPRFPWPAQQEDALAAVRWIRAHAASFRLDPARIGALGGSAGGHLAGVLATLSDGGRLTDGDRILAAVSWSGPMDVEETAEDGTPETRRVVARFLGCRRFGEACAARARAASPITRVDGSDAPMFIANGTGEAIPLHQAVEMATALDRVGVPNRLVKIPHPTHSRTYEDRAVPGSAQTVLQASIQFLHRWLSVPLEQPTRRGAAGAGRVAPKATPRPTASASPRDAPAVERSPAAAPRLAKPAGPTTRPWIGLSAGLVLLLVAAGVALGLLWS